MQKNPIHAQPNPPCTAPPARTSGQPQSPFIHGLLYLRSNGLTGAIPPELGSFARLQRLNLEDYSLARDHHLTGPIPPEFGNLASQRELNLTGNGLTGPIPPELGNLALLRELDLAGNGLTGPIPPEFGNFAFLEELNLGDNSLTGPIPPELGNLPSRHGRNVRTSDRGLQTLVLGGNRLGGPVPPELGNLAGLEVLNLAGNDLTGPIPDSFVELGALFWFVWQQSPEGDLCAPATGVFRPWLQRIRMNSMIGTVGAGPLCAADGRPK